MSPLTWTTKPGSTRADSNVGGYWITWTPMPGWPAPWHNAWVMEAGKKRNLEAGTKHACLDACQAHYAKSSAVPVCDNVRPLETTSHKIDSQVTGSTKSPPASSPVNSSQPQRE